MTFVSIRADVCDPFTQEELEACQAQRDAFQKLLGHTLCVVMRWRGGTVDSVGMSLFARAGVKSEPRQELPAIDGSMTANLQIDPDVSVQFPEA